MPTHQRPVYQLHFIRCGTIIASLIYRVNSIGTAKDRHYVYLSKHVTVTVPHTFLLKSRPVMSQMTRAKSTL